MFRIKICGITNVEDAALAVDAQADAVGLNFYPASPRFCPAEQAQEIARMLPRSVCKVGVFVNATVGEIRRSRETLGLDLVQLHGDEPPEMLRELLGVPILRAFRASDDWGPTSEYLKACHRLACMPRMVLVDRAQSGQYGGTGKTLDWPALAAARRHLDGVPLVLAGGLKPDNVAEEIATVRPWAVDTASGVESSPGKKSAALVRQFVEAAQHALALSAVAR
jgi:phosphoribosylanthranilate isomerase